MDASVDDRLNESVNSIVFWGQRSRMDKVFQQLEYSLWEKLALARVEPFGLHLFEFIHYCLLGLLILWTLRVFFRTLAMMRAPSNRDMLELPPSLRVEHVQCTSCEWTGNLPKRNRKCPACGGDAFINI